MKYSASQIKEFAKMGYKIDESGNLIKEIRIQKIIRTNSASETIRNIELKEKEYKNNIIADRKSPVGYTKVNSRIKEFWLDPERLARGLVTARQKGVDYNALPDGTKVCRCCQNRLKIENFSNAVANKDGKMYICKECDNRRVKSYKKDLLKI